MLENMSELYNFILITLRKSKGTESSLAYFLVRYDRQFSVEDISGAFNYLHSENFICKNGNQYIVTPQGNDYIIKYQEACLIEDKIRLRTKKLQRRDNIRWVLTTLISLIALWRTFK